MLIRVKYVDNTFDLVRPEYLDRLLEKGVLAAFLRRDGWVIPALDVLRGNNQTRYSGIDRRNRRAIDRRGVQS